MLLFKPLAAILITMLFSFKAWSAPSCSKTFSWSVDGVSAETLVAMMSVRSPEKWRSQILYKEAEAVDFHGSAYANAFVELARAERLLHQADHRLGQKGLLDDRGGLCGPTCSANAVMSILIGDNIEFNGVQYRRSRDLPANVDVKTVEVIVDRYKDFVIDHYGRSYNRFAEYLLIDSFLPGTFDPKLGMIPEHFNSATEGIYNAFGAQFINNIAITPSNLEMVTNQGLLIGTVEVTKFGTGEKPELDQLHAVTILKVDTASREITVSEPNSSNFVWTVPYETRGSSLVFEAAVSLFEKGHRTQFKLIDAQGIVSRQEQQSTGNIVVDGPNNIESGYREPVVEAGAYREPVVEASPYYREPVVEAGSYREPVGEAEIYREPIVK